jgi:hypothetical protein
MLTIDVRWSLAEARTKRKHKGRNSLPDFMEMVIGMEVMLMVNIEMELEVANGAQEIIVDIKLDRCEGPINQQGQQICLMYQPGCVLVKMSSTRANRILGLDPGVVGTSGG